MEYTAPLKNGMTFTPKPIQKLDDSTFVPTVTQRSKQATISKSWNPKLSKTQFSCWSPLVHKPTGQQIFKERVELISHWFDLWSNGQRNEFFDHMLSKSHNVQYAHVQNWFNKRVPLQHIDFTRLLPRFLALYIFSFLDPKSLCRASQVSWYWKFLTEQESIWIPKCTKRGWYLPYNTNPNEYGCWKHHYISCVSTIEYILPEKNNGLTNTTDPRERKRSPVSTDYKSLRTQGSLYGIRPIWKGPDFKPKDMERSFYAFLYGNEPNIQKTSPSYITVYNNWKINTKENNYLKQSLNIRNTIDQFSSLYSFHQPLENMDYRSRMLLSETQAIENFNETRTRYLIEQPWEYNWDLSFCNPVQRKPEQVQNLEYSRMVLISSRVPGAELLFSATHPNVLPIFYDYEGTTVDSLRLQVEQTLTGRNVKSIGLFCHDEEPGKISLVDGCYVDVKSLYSKSDVKMFFETLSCCIVKSARGGQFDIFSSLAASENGIDLMVELKTLTQIKSSSPSSIVGGTKKVLGIWLYGNHELAGCSSLNYFNKNKLNSWANMARLTEEAVAHCKQNLALFFDQFQQDIVYRLVGEIIFDVVGQFPTEMCRLTNVLCEALLSIKNLKNGDSLKHLTFFLMEKCGLKQNTFKQMKEASSIISPNIVDEKENIEDKLQSNTGSNPGRNSDTYTRKVTANHTDSGMGSFSNSGHLQESCVYGTIGVLQTERKLITAPADRRRYIATEIINTEMDYVRLLSGFKTKYFKPLKSALESNRPIISQQNVEIIFTDILINLKLHRKLCEDLKKRFSEWEGMTSCFGDIFVDFCRNLAIYANLVNNHEAILRCIERCREHMPSFRAFLTRNEYKPEAKLLTLPEILLKPLDRIEEYVYLLTALLTYTAIDHPDRSDLFQSICSFKEVNSFIQQTKLRRQQQRQLQKLRTTIINCPVLTEGNRYFLKQQVVSLLVPILPTVASDLRIYQCTEVLGLYLFNDSLIVTRKVPRQLPLSIANEKLYTFEYSLPLTVVRVKNVPNTKYVCNAFQLKSPSNRIYCCTESHMEKVKWLSILQQTLRSVQTW